MIKLDINIGDTILVGRFKNKRIEVKEIGIDEHGLPTINGRSILKIRIEKLMKTEKQIKESISNIIGKFKDQFEKLKYYTKINSDGSITAYYDKYNPDRLTISITEHPGHPAGRFYLYIYNKVEVSSTSLADPKAAYQTTSARIAKHSTKKVRKYYDDLKKLIVDINKVLSRNNFTLLDYSDINESKQFSLADIAKKILKT